MTNPPFPRFDPDEADRHALRAFEALVDSASGTLKIARALVEANRTIDLAGLDQMVGRLCAGALDLSPAAGRSVRSRLRVLQTELDALGVVLSRAAPTDEEAADPTH